MEKGIRRVAYALPPGNAENLERVAAENVVLFAAGTLRTLQTADNDQGHSHCDDNGDDVFVGHEPLNQAMHRRHPQSTYSMQPASGWTLRLTCLDAL
jgi:hypothetical protein